MENLKVNVVETKPCLITLGIEVPVTEVSTTTERIYQQIQREAQIPGFRAGKAPMDMIKKNYQSACREKVVENLIQRSIIPAFKQQGIEPVSYPSVDEVDFDFNKPFTFKITAELHPTFKVKDYKGIKVKKEISPVTDEKVSQALDSLRERNARLADTAVEVAGDKQLLMADYTAVCDGEPIKELKGESQLIDLSVPQMIDGFREGLVGIKKGVPTEVPVTFPKDFTNKRVAGKKVIFTVTVKEIKEKILPELNDELAKDMGLASLAELQTKVKESLEAEEARRQKQSVEKQLIDGILEANTFDVPKSLIEEQLAHIMEDAAQYFKKHGLPQAVYQKRIDDEKAKYRVEAERNVRLSYLLNGIIDEEKLAVTDDDMKAEREKLLAANAGKEADVEKYIKENEEKVRAFLKEEKLFKFLESNAKIKEEVKK